MDMNIENDLEDSDDSPYSPGGVPWIVEYKHRIDNPNEKFAVKSLRRAYPKQDWLVNEVSLLMLANNLKIPNVIQLIAVYESQLKYAYTHFSLLFPRYDVLSVHLIQSLQLEEIANIILQISNALKSLHQYGIVHLDIKTANIVYDSAHKEAYIIDFGHATLLYPGAVHQYDCGTEAFRAPELYNRKRIFTQSDLYSLGVVLIHLLLPYILPHLMPIHNNNNNNNSNNNDISPYLNSELWMWHERLESETVDEYLDFLRNFISSPSFSSLPFILSQLCKIAVNLTLSKPRSRRYISSSLFQKENLIPHPPPINNNITTNNNTTTINDTINSTIITTPNQHHKLPPLIEKKNKKNLRIKDNNNNNKSDRVKGKNPLTEENKKENCANFSIAKCK